MLTVLLPTYNGAAYLSEQLDSIARQRLLPDLLMISDDGSSDDTRAIAERFADAAPFQVVLRTGPQAGLAANMRSLLGACPAGYVALADQDDVWLPHKLAQAVGLLEHVPTPALYAARRVITDACLTPRGLTALPRAAAGFAHALRRNIAPGNTVVINPAAQALAGTAARQGGPLPAFHDWWLYQLVTGAGGAVIFDPEPALLYRQHGGNLFGASIGLRAGLWRLRSRCDGTYRKWVQAQCAALDAQRHLLEPAAAAALDRFRLSRLNT